MSSLTHTVTRNTLVSLASQGAMRLLSLVFAVVVVRHLGGEAFGHYATVIAFVGILSVFGDCGMAGYAMREIGRARDRVGQLFGNMVVLRILLSLGMIAVNVGLAMLLRYRPVMVLWIGLASLNLLLYAVCGPLTVVLRGIERADYASMAEVVNQAAFIAVGALIVCSGGGVTGLILASFCGVIAAALFQWRMLRRAVALPLVIDRRDWLPLLRAGLPFAVTTFTTMLSFKADTVLLSLWRTATEVAWYNVAYNLVLALQLTLGAFTSVLLPSLSRQHARDPESVPRFYARALRIVWAGVLPVAVGTSLLADRIIVLIFGDAFQAAGLALRILIWALPALALTGLSGSIATVLHRERALARINIVNALFNVGCNLLVIPRFGVPGAAVLTVVTELAGLLQFGLLLRDSVRLREIGAACAAPLPAVAVMAATVLILRPWPLALIIATAAALYSLTLLLSGGLRLTEIRSLADTTLAVVTGRPTAAVGD